MSDTADKRHVKCKFGLVNLAGLIPMRNKVEEVTGAPLSAEILVPLFSHESYKVKTTFNTNLTFFGTSQNTSRDFAVLWFDQPDANNGKHYQKKFRRDVLWDFGDGTQVHGYNAEHHYTKPGRYKITCTFFDINRRGWVNDFCLYVIVKEVIPTMLRFDKSCTKTSIKCSKIERIARIESLISNNVDKELNVSVKRIFSKEEHESNYKEIGRSYDDIPKNDFFHMEQYWCSLKNTQTLFYNSNQIYTSELTPSDLYTPRYNKLYCKFFYDEKNKESAPIGLSFYQVIPYKKIDDNLKKITVTNPYTTITDRQTRKTYDITQVYTEDQLPEGVTYCGMRGWVDIFYKNDYIGNPNTLSIVHDIENENITGELQSSSNYLNINPLGLTFGIAKNDKDDIRIGVSSSGFLKPVEDGAKLSDSEIFVDQHLRNSLYKGIDLNCYIFPYVIYDDTDVKIMNDTYYVPKDVVLGLSHSLQTDEKYGKASEVNVNPAPEPIYPWMYSIPLILNNYIDIIFNVSTNRSKSFAIRLTEKPLLNPLSVNIPHEKSAHIDVDRLLDVYMIHPMFKDKPNLRALMKSYVGGFVEKIITEGNNFLDNTANVRTCYLSNLLSTLKMMGQDVTEFEYSSLEGINDLKKFARILSINHSDLVGHVVNVDYDITINKDNKGANVGDCIDLDNIITLVTSKPADDQPGKKDNYGKIQYVQIGSIKHQVNVIGGVDLIVHDKYTNDTKIVNFRSYLKNGGKSTMTIGEYEPFWDWNLLLPDGFMSLKEKIDEYQKRADNVGYSSEQRNFYKTEIKRLQNTRKELIRSYYDFYLLNPNKGDLRIGNFLREEDITEKIDSTAEWESIWGITHDILMKIMLENGGLMNNRDGGRDYDGDDTWKSVYINLSKSFSKGEVQVTGCDEISLYGDVIVRGEILGEGENILHVAVNNGLIDYADEFWLSTNELICEVTGNNISASNAYDISSEIINDNQIVSGSITVSLSGTLEKPVLTVNADIDYSPNITESDFNLSDSFEKSVTVDDLTKLVSAKVTAYGSITGVGKNQIELGISDSKVNDISEKITIQKDDSFTIDVNENGVITDKEHSFTIKQTLSENNDKITLSGIIKVKISGTVKHPVFEIISATLYAQIVYPDLLDSYEIYNCTGIDDNQRILVNGETTIKSVINCIREDVKVPTYFNWTYLRIENTTDGWKLKINCDVYTSNVDFNDWVFTANIEKEIPIEVNGWGNITPKTQDIKLFEDETTNPLINSPSLKIELKGNIHELTEELTISLSEEPKGLYVSLFDLKKTYEIGQTYGDNISLTNLDGFKSVRIFFDSKPRIYTKPKTISEYKNDDEVTVDVNVRLQVVKEIWISNDNGEENIGGDGENTEDDTGYWEEIIEWDLQSKLTNDILSKNPITINDDSSIVHNNYTLEFKDENDILKATLVVGNWDISSLNVNKKILEKCEYKWLQSFSSNTNSRYSWTATLSVKGEIYKEELPQDADETITTQFIFNVDGQMDSCPVQYIETKDIELNNKGELVNEHEFTCTLTNVLEQDDNTDDDVPTYDENGELIEGDNTVKEYTEFNLNCSAKISGGYGDNFTVSGTVEDAEIIFEVRIKYNDYGEMVEADLKRLVNGSYLFEGTNVGKITSGDGTVTYFDFNYDLSSLVNGERMFRECKSLTSFSSDMSKVVMGNMMFEYCDSLTTFASDLASLAYGKNMFGYCSGLTSFNSNLYNLKSGHQMFSGCKLDETSLENIVETINNLTEKGLDINNDDDWTLTLGYNIIYTIREGERAVIHIGHAEDVDEAKIIDFGNRLIEKGWNVYFNDVRYTSSTEEQ